MPHHMDHRTPNRHPYVILSLDGWPITHCLLCGAWPVASQEGGPSGSSSGGAADGEAQAQPQGGAGDRDSSEGAGAQQGEGGGGREGGGEACSGDAGREEDTGAVSISEMSVGQLKRYIAERGGDVTGLLEKQDLIACAEKLAG